MRSIKLPLLPMPFTRYRSARSTLLARATSAYALGCAGALFGMLLGNGAAAAPAASDDAGGLEEITVTAEKYTSTIQNTPISISALSGDQLAAAGLTRLEDIAHEVPGLSMRSAGPGLTEYEARGLASNGGAAPTVGFYLDEIPIIAAGSVAVRQGRHRSRSL
jgi:iron complex outermembrane receptor protein